MHRLDLASIGFWTAWTASVVADVDDRSLVLDGRQSSVPSVGRTMLTAAGAK